VPVTASPHTLVFLCSLCLRVVFEDTCAVLLYTCLHLHAALTARTDGRSQRPPCRIWENIG